MCKFLGSVKYYIYNLNSDNDMICNFFRIVRVLVLWYNFYRLVKELCIKNLFIINLVMMKI